MTLSPGAPFRRVLVALLRHEDLTPVGQRRGQVQGLEQRAGASAAGGVDRIDHAGALLELVHARVSNPTGDIDQ